MRYRHSWSANKCALLPTPGTPRHYSDVIMSPMASQITRLTVVYSSVYSGADQRKHQSSASLAFVRGIHRWPVNSPYKGPVRRKMFPFDDVIMSHALARCSGSFHTKIYRTQRPRMNSMKTFLIANKCYSNRFITDSTTRYGKDCIDPLMVSIAAFLFLPWWMPDCIGSTE